MISIKSFAAPNPLVLSRTLLGETFTCAHDALIQAYKNLDIEVNFLTLPNKRGLRMANSGEIDGEMLRVADTEIHHPNLIQVPVPICSIESILVANERVMATTYEDLKKYRFGITIGYVDQENLVEKYQLNATRVIKNNTLLEMLMRDRVDVIFLTKLESKYIISKSRNTKLKVLQGFEREMLLYHYLHKKHKALVPQITNALQALTKAGKVKLQNRTLRPIATH